MNAKRESIKRTLDHLDSMTDEDIDYSEIPPLDPKMFAQPVVRKGLKPVPRKTQITLQLDADVLEWFQRQGKGYQTRINAVLRAYKETHKRG